MSKAPMGVTSIFRDVLEEIKKSKTPEEAKSIILSRVEGSKIGLEDKISIRGALNKKRTLEQVLFYIYNAILSYEGCKVIK